VPYSANIHDDLALELALRLLVSDSNRKLAVLRAAAPGQQASEFSNEFRALMEQLPDAVRERMEFPVLEAPEPIQAVVEASKSADLTLVGTSRAWGIERQTLGRYTDELAIECHSSLLICRRHSQFTPHLASLLAQQPAASK
jgi:nucleotide-binding universal stress UspA family protein